MSGQRVGYVRVNIFDQNPDRQLENDQVDLVFTDKASGKDTTSTTGAVAAPIADGLEAHQPDGRLCLVAEQTGRDGPVQTPAADSAGGLACSFFRFVR